MILVDTSVWVDHLRVGDEALSRLHEGQSGFPERTKGQVFVHPFVIGELALGNLKNREVLMGLLQELPRTPIASDDEVLRFIDHYALFGTGIGYIDAHLLAATKLAAGSVLWTRDKRLQAVGSRLGLANSAIH